MSAMEAEMADATEQLKAREREKLSKQIASAR